jgi:hypothetical protein
MKIMSKDEIKKKMVNLLVKNYFLNCNIRIKMDKIVFEEIVSILAMHGRPDLISEFKDHVKIDEDYKPL